MNGRLAKTLSSLLAPGTPGTIAALGRRALPALMALLALLAPAALLLTPLAIAAGCGKASPTAPTGSTLTLNINPTTVVSARGTALATATLIRPNGTPDPGAQVTFNTTLGTFSPTVVATKNNGTATSTLTGSGLAGTAKVTAFSGAVMSTEVDVMLGSLGASITLQASPATLSASLPPGGAKINLVAVVRDATGLPEPGEEVNFTTTVGTLRSGGGLVPTDATGKATDVLTVKPTDISTQTTIVVGADTANGSGAIQNAMFTINILTVSAATIVVSGNPTTLPASGGNVNLSALVRDAIGNPVANVGVSFSTTIGTFKSSGTSQGAIQTTGTDGTVTDTLVVQPQTAATSGAVTASAPGAGGSLISSTPLTITVLAPTGRAPR
ncbi:MAG TPA: Ig-like domain-containing protein [Thermoanaerobaculia bacterium]|jgi:hypothetical protein|nr:Ig-like domain-containing protein [Thermoanaerobaculia bacterium]